MWFFSLWTNNLSISNYWILRCLKANSFKCVVSSFTNHFIQLWACLNPLDWWMAKSSSTSLFNATYFLPYEFCCFVIEHILVTAVLWFGLHNLEKKIFITCSTFISTIFKDEIVDFLLSTSCLFVFILFLFCFSFFQINLFSTHIKYVC